MPGTPKYSNLIAAIATIASCDIALGFTFQLLPLLMDQQHIPARIIGLNTAMGPLGILLAGPVLPHVIGKLGPKRMAYAAVACIITALVIFKSTSSLYVWFPLRFLTGIATGTLFAISEAWILTFAGGNRGRIMGFYTSVMAVTFSVGPFLLPFTGTEGWTPWLIGILCLCLSALPLAFVDVTDDMFRDEEGGNFLRFVKRAPLLLFAVGSATLFDSVFISFFTIFGLRSGLSLQMASWILGFGIIGNVLFLALVGSLADKWSRLGVIVCAAIITVAMSGALIFAVHSWLVLPVVIILSTSAFSVYVVSLAIMGDTFKGSDLIAGSAAFSAMWGVGGLIGPPIAGAAIDRFGVDAMPATLGVTYIVLLVGLAITGGRLVRDERHG